MRPLFNPSCEMGFIAVCLVKRCWIMYTVITRIAHQVISVAKVHNSSVIFLSMVAVHRNLFVKCRNGHVRSCLAGPTGWPFSFSLVSHSWSMRS